MTEQELRDEFESLGYIEQYRYDLNKNESGNYTSNDTFKLWRGFCFGHLLAQETIAELESRLEQNADMSVVTELNETIKAKDSEINKWYREWYNEHTKSQKAIAEVREIVNGFWAWFHIKSTRTAPVEFLEKAKAWLENNK